MKTRIILTGCITCMALLAATRAAETPAPTASATPAGATPEGPTPEAPTPPEAPSPEGATPVPSPKEVSDTAARLELARILAYDKKYAEAIDTFRQVLAADPENLDAKIGLSEALYWSGNIDAASKELKSVPEDKLDGKQKLTLAELLAAKKDYEAAVRIFSAYLEKKPDDLVVRLKLADTQSWMKRYSDAIANYEIILKARPNDRQVRRKYGMVLSWAGQNAKAAEELRKSLEPQ